MLTSLQYVECKVSLAVGPAGPRRAPHAPSGRRRARTYGSSVFPRVTLQRVRGAVSASATHAPVPTDLTAKRAPDRLPSASRHPSSPTGKDPPSWGARGPAARPHPLPACRAPAPAGPRRDVLTGLPSLPGAPSFPGGPGGPCGPGTSRASGPGTSGPAGSWEGSAGWGPHARLSGRPPLCPPAPRAGLSITQGRAGGRTETGGVGARPGRPGHPLSRPTCCLCSGQNPPGTPTSCWARGMERKGVRPGPSGQCAGTRHGAALGRGGGLTSSRLSSGLRTFPSPVAAVCEPGRVWAGWGRGGQTPGQRPRLSLAALSAPRAARRPLGPA